MRNPLAFTLFLILGIIQLCAQAPEFNWVKRIDGNLNDYANAIVHDRDGNLYIAGSFASYTLVMGDTVFVNHASQTKDIFFAKLDPDGNVIWARHAGNTEDDEALCLTTDPWGNLYVAGLFCKTVDFDGITLSTEMYNDDIFLLKYNTDGDIQWAKQFGADYADYPASLCSDSSGNIYFTGRFMGSPFVMDTIVLQGNGDSQMFLCKINPEGKVVWGIGGSQAAGSGGYDLVTDRQGNLYYGASFYGYSFMIDTVTMYSAGDYDFFIAKFNQSGKIQWVRKFGGTKGESIRKMALGPDSSVYITGYYISPTLEIGNTVLTNSTIYDGNLFLARLDAEGNPLWAKSAEGNSIDWITGLEVDELGCPYICGYYDSFTLTFDTITLNNLEIGENDIFLAKYNKEGSVIWVSNIGGNHEDYCMGMTMDGSGELNLTGYFNSDNIWFGAISLPSTVGNLSDIFIANTEKAVGIDKKDFSLENSIYPNPNKGNFTIIIQSKADKISLYNQKGALLQSWQEVHPGPLKIAVDHSGLYILHCLSGEISQSYKVVVE
jgi:hypothetical protein